MLTIKPLDQITHEDEQQAGAKAYQCARLKQAGFAVPDGLVILASATEADLASLTDHAWFANRPGAERYAVRSSAADEDGVSQSFAGIHETVLDVAPSGIVAAVRSCRASIRSARALAYRRSRGLPLDALQTGVLVQRMIQPVASGVAFTIDPITGAGDTVIINASFGIGESLVAGQIDPDEFHVRKHDGVVISSRIGEKTEGSSTPSLTSGELAELATLLLAIERHYGAPQDVEWCRDERQFWIVQSRPVTTATTRPTGPEWTRANLVEVLPEVTSPQALDSLEELLNTAERQFMRGLTAPESELGPIVKAFHGRLYFNLSQLRRVCALGGVPAALVLRSMGHHGAIEPADERPAPVPFALRLRAVPDLLRLAGRHVRVHGVVHRLRSHVDDRLARWSAIDAERATDQALWDFMEEWRRESPRHMQVVLTLGGVLFHEAPLRRMCERVGMPYERLLFASLATGERSISAQQAFDLLELANVARLEPDVRARLLEDPVDIASMRRAAPASAFVRAFDRFIERYGHRGVYETDWSLPRYSEDPTPILVAVREQLRGPAGKSSTAIAADQARQAADAWLEFERRMTAWQRLTALPRARYAVRRIKQYYVWREQCRFDMIRVMALIRAWHLILARRFVDRGWLDDVEQYFLITRAEIAPALDDPEAARSLRTLAHARAAEQARLARIPMPLLMRESELPMLIRTAGVTSPESATELTGHGVSAGRIEAEVVVIKHPADFDRMKRGAILVTRATDPSWTPLFTLASGVIVEVGGVLSHASTIAREFGLPAIANVRNATRRLRTGERVLLDASSGVVRRLEP